MVKPHEDNSSRWKLSIEATSRLGPYEGIKGMYENYSLKQVKEIISGMRKAKVSLPVDKVMPITSWLLLYGFMKFEERLGSEDYLLAKIEVEDTRDI